MFVSQISLKLLMQLLFMQITPDYENSNEIGEFDWTME